MPLCAQSTHWRVEAESPKTRILQRNDTLDIVAPQGLSLWWDEPLVAPCTITYRACVVNEGGVHDRLSDLNCFWMANDPMTQGSPLRGISQRQGRFVESYRLQCYYLGFGGNYNTTTRFRRYTGESLAVTNAAARPAILREYTDAAHLLRPNHWYEVRIEVSEDGRSSYWIDGELLIDYKDAEPLLKGWFAFRTTLSHIRLTAWCLTSRDKK